ALQRLAPGLNERRIEADGRAAYVVPRERVAKELALALGRDPARTLSLLSAAGCRHLLLPACAALPSLAAAPPLSVPFAPLYRDLPARRWRELLPPFGEDLEEAAWIAERLRADVSPAALPASAFEARYLVPRGARLLEAETLLGLPRAEAARE